MVRAGLSLSTFAYRPVRSLLTPLLTHVPTVDRRLRKETVRKSDETVGRGQKVIQTGNLRAKRIIITKNPSVSISLRLVCGQDDSLPGP